MRNTQDGTTALADITGDTTVLPLATASGQDALEQAKAQFEEIPDIRMDKVAEMRARIAAGTFRPTAEQLADAILDKADAIRTAR